MKSEIKGLNSLNLKNELNKKIKGLSENKRLEMGFFESAKYQNGKYVANVAKWQEYGTIRTPARPFFRPAIDKNGNKWLNIFKSQVASNGSIELSLNKVGELSRGDLIKQIMQTNTPPNAESTIRIKGSSKPLIDTGFLRASVSFKVV